MPKSKIEEEEAKKRTIRNNFHIWLRRRMASNAASQELIDNDMKELDMNLMFSMLA